MISVRYRPSRYTTSSLGWRQPLELLEYCVAVRAGVSPTALPIILGGGAHEFQLSLQGVLNAETAATCLRPQVVHLCKKTFKDLWLGLMRRDSRCQEHSVVVLVIGPGHPLSQALKTAHHLLFGVVLQEVLDLPHLEVQLQTMC